MGSENKTKKKVMDVVIPIVFPDYKIAVMIPKTKVDIIPWVEWDNFTIQKRKEKFSDLGHAGVLFINGKNGLTKYYEYGRYDAAALGLVRKISISNVRIKDGEVVYESLKRPLRQISSNAGQRGHISAVYIEVEGGKFSSMSKFANVRMAQNKNPNRMPYSLTGYSCVHFAKDVVKTSGADTPWMIDPRPNSYIGEFRDDYSDLDYTPGTNKLIIEGKGEF